MIPINFEKRRAAVARKVEEAGFDAYLGTRTAALHYLGGVFMPWRGIVIVTKRGDCRFVYWKGDSERVRLEGPPMKLATYGVSNMIDVAVGELVDLGVADGKIGVDLELFGNAQLAPGMLTASEYLALCRALPGADIQNGVALLDDVILLKDEAEIERLRLATAAGDYGYACGLAAIKPGVTENHIAGVIEKAIRDKGSYWSWSVTAGTEVGSGERTAYLGGVTNISTERKIRKNEFVILDLHPAVDLYYADISVPAFIGRPNDKQKHLIECWETAVATVFDAIRPGVAIADVVRKGVAVYERFGLAEYGVNGFGHGLGVCARTAPAIKSYCKAEFLPGMVFALGAHLYQPGVGGMRLEYPVMVGKERAESLGSTEFRTHYVEL
ncbi:MULTISPECIES: M24 family metallopeptidase [Anaerotruncus]|jgi:metallopeptidase family M24 family protein 1|uniref:M24 family metallopeptidase n=1 Tax=Anaerotruncus TaxID=244127 RepID=UPI000C788FEB|nr:Xaa-Pro peptidase family protein [Anaerotruncus massiliensis (ex Togo et al. 2019)]